MTPPIHRRTRSYWLLLLVLPLVVVIAISSFAAVARQENSWVRHTLLVQLSLERLLFDLDNAETSQRGYLLTRQDRFLQPYREAQQRVLAELAMLRALTADNSRQQRAIADLAPVLETKLSHMQQNIAAFRGSEFDSAALESRIDEGKALMDSIHAMVGAMRREEDSLLKDRERHFLTAANRFTWSIALGGFIMIAVAAFLYRGVARYSRQVVEAERNLSRLNSELELRVQERTSSLRASEQLLKTFVKHVPAAVAMLDRDLRYLQVSDRWCADYALTPETLLGRTHYEVFPDLPDRWKQIHQRCLAGESLRASEDCWDRAPGLRTWLHWEIRPWGPDPVRPDGILILAEDITERKRMEEALRDSERELRALAAGLLTAQEDERRRIARDLHDDVTQRLAFLSMEIGKLAAEQPAVAPLRALQSQVIDVSQEVRRLSHGLHPSVIEDFGLSTALEEFCDEFARSHPVQVRFQGPIDDAGLSLEAASCLYRVAQESIHNAVKHAAAAHISVALSRGPDAIELRVTDDGPGFPAEPDRARAGLGVVSMKERMRIIHGALSITSRPGQGTEVVATAPLSGGNRETLANTAG